MIFHSKFHYMGKVAIEPRLEGGEGLLSSSGY